MTTAWQKFRSLFRGDKYMLAAIAALVVASVLAVYSSSSVLAYQHGGDGDIARVIMRHLFMLALGVGFMGCVSRISPRVWYGLSWILLGIAVILQAATLVVGTSINGASRWLSVGGISFQPSELSKFFLMIFVARQLSRHYDNPTKAFWFIAGATALVCMLIVLENLSTCILIVASVWIVMFVARVSIIYLLGSTMIVGGVLALALLFAPQLGELSSRFYRLGTWRARVERYIGGSNAEESAAGNYQAEQAKAAVCTGGLLFGKGPGNSYMKNFLPMAFSDFIFAIIIEEYGVFPGCLVILVAYFAIFARAFYVARHCNKPFCMYLVFGLGLLLTFQALINMAVGVGLMPVTGQTLTLVSMGGTSNVCMGMAFGIMLAISHEAREQRAAAAKTSEIK